MTVDRSIAVIISEDIVGGKSPPPGSIDDVWQPST